MRREGGTGVAILQRRGRAAYGTARPGLEEREVRAFRLPASRAEAGGGRRGAGGGGGAAAAGRAGAARAPSRSALRAPPAEAGRRPGAPPRSEAPSAPQPRPSRGASSLCDLCNLDLLRRGTGWGLGSLGCLPQPVPLGLITPTHPSHPPGAEDPPGSGSVEARLQQGRRTRTRRAMADRAFGRARQKAHTGAQD